MTTTRERTRVELWQDTALEHGRRADLAERRLAGSEQARNGLIKTLDELLAAFDAHMLEMNSPEIGGDGDIPPHRWHEEWLYRARAALTSTKEDAG